MKKKVIVILLLLVFTMQNLPFEQLIQPWVDGQMAEEMPNDDSPEKSKDKSYYVVGSLFELPTTRNKVQSNSKIVSSGIPLNHAIEIHVPPPNC